MTLKSESNDVVRGRKLIAETDGEFFWSDFVTAGILQAKASGVRMELVREFVNAIIHEMVLGMIDELGYGPNA